MDKKETKLFSDFKVLGAIILFCIILIGLAFLPSKNSNEREGYLILSNETMICDYYYICFFFNGTWHKPKYNAGTNLIAANKLKIENEKMVKEFFEQPKINLVVETTEGIVETMPFAYYLSYYYNTFKKEPKEIVPSVTSQYNYKEPALIILGPNSDREDAIKYDGKNLIVNGKTRESLSLLLGKLLLVIVS
jgi:hypothetical protein